MIDPYYADDHCVIYCGDAREIIPALPHVDHVMTDPPYSEDTHQGARKMTNAGAAVLVEFPSIPVAQIADTLAAIVYRRWLVFTCDLWHLHTFRDDKRLGRFVRAGVWVKTNPAPQFTGDRPGNGWEPIAIFHTDRTMRWNGGGSVGVWQIPTVRVAEYPTQKPEQLLIQWVIQFTDPGDLILDPFMGSGTTIAAAKRLGRKAIGIDISERACAIAAERARQSALIDVPAPLIAAELF